MNVESPIDALRLLAGLIAADLRAGSPVLALPLPLPGAEEPARGRGRPKSIPFAVAAFRVARAA